ncbi:coiled-coil domain-containing protein 94 [Willisornis vidua]|uniref:Coiled-coil domain-containing protein 94 n=1 Tax=Willisornis vidua TaxID=1566151 RepID=A0ABQ9E0U3_9PASS|nr:coiled-coil domain-containing protein 94 [Willisornis vidua]
MALGSSGVSHPPWTGCFQAGAGECVAVAVAGAELPQHSHFPALFPPQTDPENTDYTMEHGATRNFQAEKLLEEEEKRMQKEREEEELNNPMKVLENRTKDSKLEMEVLENLQELKELNQRQANVDFEAMLKQYKEYEEEQKRREQEEDEQEMK